MKISQFSFIKPHKYDAFRMYPVQTRAKICHPEKPTSCFSSVLPDQFWDSLNYATPFTLVPLQRQHPSLIPAALHRHKTTWRSLHRYHS